MGRLTSLRRAYRSLYDWATERLYHELAWGYEIVAWVVSLGRWDDWRCQVLEHVIGRRVLEIGFGTGVVLQTAADRGMSIFGADPSPEMHRVAARRMRRSRGGAPRVRATAQLLPFADGSFDTVISTFPTGYIFDPDTLSEITRVLSHCVDGGSPGRLVITGLGFRSDRTWLRRLLRTLFAGSDTDSVALYAGWVAELGFQVTVVDDVDLPARVPVLILQWPVRSEEV
ncbi:MAG: class I SAM-dependent methyltransferase [Anaerolineae bacterium]|nr:class I SAM-dependent methyltransferase [Anaerolineae bacterium]